MTNKTLIFVSCEIEGSSKSQTAISVFANVVYKYDVDEDDEDDDDVRLRPF